MMCYTLVGINLKKMKASKYFIMIYCFSLLFGCTSSSDWETLYENSESEISKYDPDFIKYSLTNQENIDLKKKGKFQFLNSFHEMFKIKDESILDSRFMKKPSKNELLSLYLTKKIKWNSFNTGFWKSSNEEIVYKELDNFPSEKEMLAFYYSGIFIQVLNNQRTINSNKIDLDYTELGLNKVEGDILFLSSMRHCGNQVTSYSASHFPKNCFRAHAFIEKLPTFNGKSFMDYELSSFKDFQIHIDKRNPKMSFKEHYLPYFNNAKSSYRKCLGQTEQINDSNNSYK